MIELDDFRLGKLLSTLQHAARRQSAEYQDSRTLYGHRSALVENAATGDDIGHRQNRADELKR